MPPLFKTTGAWFGFNGFGQFRLQLVDLIALGLVCLLDLQRLLLNVDQLSLDIGDFLIDFSRDVGIMDVFGEIEHRFQSGECNANPTKISHDS
jgi:hypothetical protein